MKLRLSEDLTLPTDAVTATLVVYGGKGMGKTNLGSVLVEELTRCGLRWSWLDPLGVSWGLRHSADGAGRGIECLILGGPHGDIPIEPDGGAAVADVVVEERVNVLIDFSRKPSGEMWSVGERVRFVTAYALRLFQRQGELVNGRRREPLFQVLDEAARYVPQVIPSGAAELAKCVGAWEQLVEEGRNVGLGVGLLTQRSARMNKSVSELADAMFAFRTVGPNSLDAILDWLGTHVEKARIKDLAEKVRSLERGRALVVSPGWLQFEGVIGVRMRSTFDSSATPKAGERARSARGEGAKPNLDAIRQRMSATIERQKATDPKELQRQVADLKRELAKAQSAKPVAAAAPAKQPKTREVNVLKPQLVKRLEALTAKMVNEAERHRAAMLLFWEHQDELNKALLGALQSVGTPPPPPVAMRPRPQLVPAPPRPVAPPRAPRAGNGKDHGDRALDNLTGPEQKILDELAGLAALGIHQPPKPQVSALCSYANPRSGGFSGPLGRLVAAGLVSYPSVGTMALTEAGAERASSDAPPLNNAELQRRVLEKFSGPPARILDELIKAYPQALDKAELGQKLGYQNPRSGGFSGPLGTLSRLGFVSYPSVGLVAATKLLFPEGA